MLLKRWLTAIVLIPVLLLILLKGEPIAFTILVLVISFLSVSEYFKIISPLFQRSIPIDVKSISYLFTLLIIAAAHKNSHSMILLLISFNMIFMSAMVVTKFKISTQIQDKQTTESEFSVDQSNQPILDYFTGEILSIVYIPLFLSFLILLRNSDNGGHFVVWLWIIIGLSDTGAYYVGSNFGKHPLAKRVSPKKTVEGALGGLGAAALAGLFYGFIFIDTVSFPMAIIYSIITAASGQLGDLFESTLKRSGGIKDSGSILPGHGGVLDRIDGIIFAAPVAYLFKVFIL